jgi:hypothetical protein
LWRALPMQCQPAGNAAYALTTNNQRQHPT